MDGGKKFQEKGSVSRVFTTPEPNGKWMRFASARKISYNGREMPHAGRK